MRRVMGIETEYGIVVPGNPAANPMVASGDVVTAYAASRGDVTSGELYSGWAWST